MKKIVNGVVHEMTTKEEEEYNKWKGSIPAGGG